jgi:hypothetical protein
MEVGRGLVYPCQTMLDNVEIDISSYPVIKVDMMHENSKDLKLEVPPDDTALTLPDVVSRRVQWRRTSIDVDPSVAAASVSTTASQLNTSPASIFPESCPCYTTKCYTVEDDLTECASEGNPAGQGSWVR